MKSAFCAFSASFNRRSTDDDGRADVDADGIAELSHGGDLGNYPIP